MTRRALIFYLLLIGLSSPAFAQQDTAWDQFQSDFENFWEEEEEVLPEEELFAKAESYFYGRETWLGKLVRKTRGEESKAYREWWGIKRANFTRARELYQMLVDNYRYSKHAPVADLRIADCSYELEEFEQAAFQYHQFRLLHPRREEVPYALYREAMCHFEQLLKPGRDQRETREAKSLFSMLVSEFPDSEYVSDANQKIKECDIKLAEHELLVADFYFKKEQYWAAASRYRGVWRELPGTGLESAAMFQEAQCYEKLGKSDLAMVLYQRLIKDFSETEYGKKAEQMVNQSEKSPEAE